MPLRPKRTVIVDLSTDMYNSIRNEGTASLHQMDQLKQEYYQWLLCQMEQNKRQLGIGASSTTAPARSDPSEIRSPAYKKLKAMEDAEEDASELPEDVVADIAKRIRVMKKPEIESELGKRNLDTKGIKKILAERLLEALKMELLGKKTSDDEKPPGEVDATVPKAAVMQAEPQPADEQKDSRQSVVMDDAFEETAAARISNEAESMRVSLDDDKKMAPLPEPKFSESSTDGSSDTDMQRVAENARPVDLNSKAQSPKRSRSPMQKVQQVVKMFSSAAKSPRSFHSSSKPLTGDRSPLLKSSQKSNLFGQHDKKIPEPESRPLQISKAPENGSLSTGSMSAKSGSSALKSKSGLAKNNARKERIGQWRKPNTASKQPNVSSAYIANLTSISQNCSHPANEEKSRRLAQMRAKNAATGATTTTSNGVKLGKLQMPIRGLASGTKPVELKLAPGPSSSFKVKEYQAPLILSPMSTYEISDKEEDSESDCESDDEYYNKKPKKKIPSWASRDNLNPQVETQFQLGGIDPDEIFGEVETCNLQEIFSRKKSRYIKRTSSGNWCRDRATAAEKRAYKRNMQYIESSSLSSLS